MKKNKTPIIADFDAHLQKSRKGYFRQFYNGISSMFGEHNENGNYRWWICSEATKSAFAQAIEELCSYKGMKGNQGDETVESVFVCYYGHSYESLIMMKR